MTEQGNEMFYEHNFNPLTGLCAHCGRFSHELPKGSECRRPATTRERDEIAAIID